MSQENYKDGKFYARVSDILRPFTDFSHIDPEVLRKKCELGSQVHEAINDDINGNFPIVFDKGHGYLASYYKWKNTLHPEFMQSEQRYYCDEKMLTGCIDALVKFRSQKLPSLVDFKTSVYESASWTMQAHLYHLLLKANAVEISPRFLFMRLDKAGGLPHVHEYKLCENITLKCLLAIDDFWEKREKTSH